MLDSDDELSQLERSRSNSNSGSGRGNNRFTKAKANVLDPSMFETDMKYFCEWFNKNSDKTRGKLEYFYGPFSEN